MHGKVPEFLWITLDPSPVPELHGIKFGRFGLN